MKVLSGTLFTIHMSTVYDKKLAGNYYIIHNLHVNMPLILHSPLTAKNTQTAIVFGLIIFISMQL